jgi:ABC-2 type transport system ATP-binding protein
MSEVATTSALVNLSVLRVRIRFKIAVNTTALVDLPGVQVLSKDSDQDLLLQVEGEMDSLIKALAAFPVLTMETERPSLEEIFLAYYEKETS